MNYKNKTIAAWALTAWAFVAFQAYTQETIVWIKEKIIDRIWINTSNSCDSFEDPIQKQACMQQFDLSSVELLRRDCNVPAYSVWMILDEYDETTDQDLHRCLYPSVRQDLQIDLQSLIDMWLIQWEAQN